MSIYGALRKKMKSIFRILNRDGISCLLYTSLPAPYHVPYRTLYSRNIKNLFMAGRNVSVTHIALGTVRVMATTSMMGEVVGMAAKICKQYDIFPRDVYKDHLVELQDLMKKGIPTRKWDITQLPEEKSILNFDFESEH